MTEEQTGPRRSNGRQSRTPPFSASLAKSAPTPSPPGPARIGPRSCVLFRPNLPKSTVAPFPPGRRNGLPAGEVPQPPPSACRSACGETGPRPLSPAKPSSRPPLPKPHSPSDLTNNQEPTTKNNSPTSQQFPPPPAQLIPRLQPPRLHRAATTSSFAKTASTGSASIYTVSSTNADAAPHPPSFSPLPRSSRRTPSEIDLLVDRRPASFWAPHFLGSTRSQNHRLPANDARDAAEDMAAGHSKPGSCKAAMN